MSNARSERRDTSARRPATKRTGARRVALAGVTVLGAISGASACLDRPLCDSDCQPRTTNLFVDADTSRSVDKIDLLFMIDNSMSMADKQKVFADAVPDMVDRLVNPVCIDRDGVRQLQPVAPGADCEEGFAREFKPVRDIHVGVITSSLGGHGSSESCKVTDANPTKAEEANDHARLVGSRPRFNAFRALATEPTEDPTPEGFLDWNPDQKPGQDPAKFKATFRVMTAAADERGCGYEASLESIYRFLVDPAPPLDIAISQCGGAPCAVPTGIDADLLRQRKAFLRPDSLVAILLLSDENDCSIRDSGQGFLVTNPVHQPLATGSAACATNPNDPCCYSCQTTKPEQCPAEPACQARQNIDDTPSNLTCYEQKRRLGFDFLYPTSRYVAALRQTQICTSHADLSVAGCPDNDGDGKPDVVKNPLLVGDNGLARDSALVYMAGIVGVPWQDIQAKSAKDEFDIDVPFPEDQLHYKTAEVMAEERTWDIILGDRTPPGNMPPIPPLDQLMVESPFPRGGVGAVGTEQLQPPTAGRMANQVNGHEWANLRQDDLQYACIFELPVERPCAEGDACDCALPTKPEDMNPLCQAPDDTFGTKQYYAKAYPGLRELEVLKGIETQAIVASICPRQLSHPELQDYGYRPAIDAIVERLKASLKGRCLPRRLEKDETGHYPCTILEANPSGGGCDASRGRSMPNASVASIARDRLGQSGLCGGEGQASCDSFTVCALAEAGPECHQSKAAPKSVGWCYVDPEQNPEDDAELVKHCPASSKHSVRFIDPLEQTPAGGAKILVACSGAALTDEQPSAPPP